MRAAALLAVTLVGSTPASLAAIYTCTDAQGRTVFRDAACPRGEHGAPAPQASPRQGGRSAIERESPADTPIDRGQVTRILDRLDKAMARRNPKAVTALLSADAQVHWQVQGQVPAKRAMDRAGYVEYLRQVFAKADYAYKSETARVSFSKREPRATATRTLRETVLVDGRLHVAQVREKVTVEADGRELIVRALRRDARLKGGR